MDHERSAVASPWRDGARQRLRIRLGQDSEPMESVKERIRRAVEPEPDPVLDAPRPDRMLGREFPRHRLDDLFPGVRFSPFNQGCGLSH